MLVTSWCLCICICLCCCSSLVVTMVVSLVFILLLRYTAGVLLWLIVFGAIAAIGYGEYRFTHICQWPLHT